MSHAPPNRPFPVGPEHAHPSPRRRLRSLLLTLRSGVRRLRLPGASLVLDPADLARLHPGRSAAPGTSRILVLYLPATPAY